MNPLKEYNYVISKKIWNQSEDRESCMLDLEIQLRTLSNLRVDGEGGGRWGGRGEGGGME